MTMGTEPLNMKDWIEIDVFYDEEMALRREILQNRKEMAIFSRPEAAEANWEALELLAEFLPKRFPDRFRQDGNTLCNLTTGERFNISDKSLNPLEVTSRLVQVRPCPSIRLSVCYSVLTCPGWTSLRRALPHSISDYDHHAVDGGTEYDICGLMR